MMQAFYKVKPKQDTPYRQLSLSHTNGGWQVRLAGGMKWGREHAEELKVVPVESFDEGQASYDKLFIKLVGEGWKPYSPQRAWDE